MSEALGRGGSVGFLDAVGQDVGVGLAYALTNGTDRFTVSASDGNILVGGLDPSKVHTTAELHIECGRGGASQ